MHRKLNMKRVKKAAAIALAAVIIPTGAYFLCRGISAIKFDVVPSAEFSQPTFAYTTAPTSDYTEFTHIDSDYIIENVPHINQTKDFPTGCESVAAVSLMNYFGIEITPDEFIDSCLAIGNYPYYDEYGVMHGEDPNKVFIGDPRSESGYGCYSPVIISAMEAALPKGYRARALDSESISLESLCTEYVAKDQPVIIWATMEMKKAENGRSWLLPDGSEFTFIRPEHCLILIGYDEEYYYFSDSMSEEAVTAYPKQACEAAFEAMGRQAVVIEKINNETSQED